MTDQASQEQGSSVGGVSATETGMTEKKTAGVVTEALGGDTEKKTKDFQLWLIQLFLKRFFEGSLENVRRAQEKFQSEVESVLQKAKIKPGDLEWLEMARRTFGLSMLTGRPGYSTNVAEVIEKMVEGGGLNEKEKDEFLQIFKRRSEELGREAELLVGLYERSLRLGTDEDIGSLVSEGNQLLLKPEEQFTGADSISPDIRKAMDLHKQGAVGVENAFEAAGVQQELRGIEGGVNTTARDRVLRDLTPDQRMQVERQIQDLRNLPLGPAWERLFQKFERPYDDDSREWYRALNELSFLEARLPQDGTFAQELARQTADDRERVRQFRFWVKRVADGEQRDYRRRRPYNWLVGEWTDIELQTFLQRYVVAPPAGPGGASVADKMLRLKRFPSGFDASGTSKQLAKEAREGLEKIDDERLLADFAAGDIEVRDRIFEFLGMMREQLHDVEKEGKIPITYVERMEQIRRAEEGLRGMRGRGRGAGQPMPRAEMGPPPEAGAEGPAGAVAPFAHEKWQQELIERLQQEPKDPKKAIEWALNFLIEKDLDERDQYYVMQTVKDYIAGAEGKLAPDNEVWDMLTRATYQEFLTHLRLWRTLPGVQSEEQVMGVLGQISVGDVEDLTVWGKDFHEEGGVQGISFRGSDREGVAVDFNLQPADGTADRDRFRAFEIHGSDIEALLESQYWFGKFQFSTRGSPTNNLRKEIFKEAMLRKLGGRVVRTEGFGKEAKRLYALPGSDHELTIEELDNIVVHFGDVARVPSKTFKELAKDNLWLMVMGETNWELTGKRSEMNKYIEGRRTIYRWDKHFHYDKYLSKLGTKGLDFLYSGYEQDGKRKPYLNTMQKDFVSVRAREVLMPYLLNKDDLARPGKEGEKEVVLVKGVQSVLAHGDGNLAEDITKMLERKFLNSRGNWRDLEVLRALFNRDELPGWLSEEAKDQLVFNAKERNMLGEAHWDQMFAYLFTRTQGTKLSLKELNYFINRVGGEIRWVPDGQGGQKIGRVPPDDEENGRYDIVARPGMQLNQQLGAQLFFESLSRQRMFWEVDEQDRFQKEANYLRQTGAQAPKLANYSSNPTADNLIEWLLPNFGFRPNPEVRETAYRNADAVLDARSKSIFSIWNLYGERSKLTERGTVKMTDKLDDDGYTVPAKFALGYIVDGIVHPKRFVNNMKLMFKEMKSDLKELKKNPSRIVSSIEENIRLLTKGKTALRGWEPLDAWAKKNYIEKMWHAGMIDWWQKEKLMSRHILPKIFPLPIPIIGAGINDWFIRGLDVKDVKFWSIDNPRRLVALGMYGLGLIGRPLYLYLWIHDWGQATTSFWNEVVAPGLAGENAKALQIQTGK